jgi:hypothetical protein
MNKKQAIKLGESKFWETMSHKEIAMFQMFEPLLCIPFDVFHEAMEKTLNRPIHTYEFGENFDGLKQELLGEKQAPTMEEIINMIPEEKRILIIAE